MTDEHLDDAQLQRVVAVVMVAALDFLRTSGTIPRTLSESDVHEHATRYFYANPIGFDRLPLLWGWEFAGKEALDGVLVQGSVTFESTAELRQTLALGLDEPVEIPAGTAVVQFPTPPTLRSM